MEISTDWNVSIEIPLNFSTGVRTHAHSHSLTHSLTHARTHAHAHIYPLSHTHHLRTYINAHTHTHTHIHSELSEAKNRLEYQKKMLNLKISTKEQEISNQKDDIFATKLKVNRFNGIYITYTHIYTYTHTHTHTYTHTCTYTIKRMIYLQQS